MSNSDRANQFMPFASLRGYYNMVRECEKIKEPRRELSAYEQEKLSYKLSQVKKGMVIEAKYYNIDCYDTIVGIVTEVDEAFRTLKIVRTLIPFDDLLDIQSAGIKDRSA